jgi:superfamily I DNA/RNA helicase
MEIVEQKLREGVKWNEIAFCSFSRAACQEAAQRAAVITGVDSDRLRTEGHFKTLHAMAFRGLSLDSKVIIDHDTKAGREFVAECCGMPRGGEAGTLGDKIDQALTAWDISRARLSRLIVQEVSHGTNPSVTATSDCWDTKSQQIREVSHAVTPCHTSAVPAFFDAKIEKPAIFEGSDRSDYTLIGGHFSETENNKSAAESKKECDSVTETKKSALYSVKDWKKSCTTSSEFGVTGCDTCDRPEFQNVIRQFEDAKRYSGQLDFFDILMRFAGFEADSDLNFRRCYPLGTVPYGIQVLMLDEYQDCSRLLDAVAERIAEGLPEASGELWRLGDRYQSVYSFAGSDSAVFASREREAKNEGRRIILNKSYRNPNCVIDWGEQVLREDSEYEERKPYSDIHGGSVGMSEMSKFMAALPMMAKRDTMIVARTWFALGRVKDRLDQLCIPWASVQEKKSSQWEAPVKIAIVLTMRALRDGEKISEQDFRRLTENFPAKHEGVELFKRGEKARWKKMTCSHDLVFRLEELEQWGAAEAFVNFVLEEKWRKDMFLLLDTAIDKFGIDVVREPKIRIGSCHSVKGLQAMDVYCLATSSEKASQSTFAEDLCLRYTVITRALKNYRCIVDLVEHGRGRKLFLACPKDYWQFSEVFTDEQERIEDPKRDSSNAEQTSEHLGSEVRSVDLRDDRSTGHPDLQQWDVHRDGSEVGGRRSVGDAEVAAEEDPFSEWDFGRSSFG